MAVGTQFSSSLTGMTPITSSYVKPRRMATPASVSQPVPQRSAVDPVAPVPAPTPAPAPIPAPVPQAPSSMVGLNAALGQSPLDAISGGTGNELRKDLGNRQPPSLQALLQGLRY